MGQGAGGSCQVPLGRTAFWCSPNCSIRSLHNKPRKTKMNEKIQPQDRDRDAYIYVRQAASHSLRAPSAISAALRFDLLQGKDRVNAELRTISGQHHILAAGFGSDLQVLQFTAAINSLDGGITGCVEFEAYVPLSGPGGQDVDLVAAAL